MRNKKNLSLARSIFEGKNRSSDVFLHELLPYVSLVNNETVVTKDGELIGTVILHGYQSETALDNELQEAALAFSQLISQIGDHASIYVNKVVSHRGFSNNYISGDGFAAHIDREWSKTYDRIPAMQRYTLVSFGVRPNLGENLIGQITGEAVNSGKRERLLERLDTIISEFVDQFERSGARRLNNTDGELLGYLSSIQSAEYGPIYNAGPIGGPIAYYLTDRDFVFGFNNFQIERADGLRDYGVIFALKNYPNSTEPGIYDGFDIPCRMVITNVFLPLNAQMAEQKTSIIQKQRESAGSYSTSLNQELNNVLDDLSAGRVSLGNHYSVVMLLASSEQELDRAALEIVKHGRAKGGRFIRENIAMRSMYFAQFPGNQAFSARTAAITSKNFADLVAFHNRPEGAVDGVPWGKPVTYFRTKNDEVYAFNFHSEMRVKNELTAGHTLIVGATGTGKTLTTLFLAAQAKRFDTRIFAFDKDRGMEIGLRALGCRYTTVAIGQATGLNPFLSETDSMGETWLSGFIEDIASDIDSNLDELQRRRIAEVTKMNSNAFASGNEALCNFEEFVSNFRSVEDGGQLYSRLLEWVTGKYSWLFDGKGNDPLSDSEQSVGFDVSELLDDDRVRNAWLSYILRRIDRSCDDGKPTLIIIDEAWRMLGDETFRNKIDDWLRTMRKKNCVVVLLSQQAKDFTSNANAASILGNIETYLLFRSPRNNEDDYKELGLNDGEAALMKSSASTRSVLCKNGNESIILDVDLSALGKTLDILGGGKAVRNTLKQGWEANKNFWKGHIL